MTGGSWAQINLVIQPGRAIVLSVKRGALAWRRCWCPQLGLNRKKHTPSDKPKTPFALDTDRHNNMDPTAAAPADLRAWAIESMEETPNFD